VLQHITAGGMDLDIAGKAEVLSSSPLEEDGEVECGISR